MRTTNASDMDPVRWAERERCYGVDREELADLREANSEHLATRLTASEVNDEVGAYLRENGRSTARRIYNDTGIFLPDIRQSLARLVDLGVVERDGDIWEESTQTGHRFAAAYAWKNTPGKKKPRKRGHVKPKK